MIQINEKIAELIGAIIGDGCISYKPKIGQYFVEIVGNQLEEVDYFNYLSSILFNDLQLKCRITKRERGLRLKVYSKSFIMFLVRDLKLVPNKEKCKNIFIPHQIISNEILLKSCIRGIADTDGSLFLANKGYRQNYPTIEISTISKNLADQINVVLSRDFRIGFRSYQPRGFNRIYRISLNGDTMVDLWMQKIGFSNRRNLNRYKKYKVGLQGFEP